MIPLSLDVHPIYGAIYKDGEFVQRGDILGLSVDSKDVVVAPVSGWVRLVAYATEAPDADAQHRLKIEIWQKPMDGELAMQ